jgi:diaminopimelate epimerase
MNIHFAKMHGLGNDFMVINNLNQSVNLSPAQIRYLANRHTGVGFDQLLIIAPATNSDVDFDYHIYNADGSASGQCGNGARCFALFVQQHNLADKTALKVQTSTGMMHTQIHADQQISVHMGQANFMPATIPCAPDIHNLQQQPYTLTTAKRTYTLSILSVGNPHAVLKVNDIDGIALAEYGSDLQASEHFPQQVNVGAMQILDNNHIKLRVYERGAGETLACGSGACAAAVAARLHYGLAENIKVIMQGGTLDISYSLETNQIIMTGSAHYVFDGTISLE